MAERRSVELMALPADGLETQFDGSPLAPGIHLRWSFRPELGWPSGGFELRRRFWVSDEFGKPHPQTFQPLATLALPPAGDGGAVIVKRVRTVTSGASLATYEGDVASLLHLIDQVRSGSPIAARRGSQQVSLSATDLLLLASLDPYVARAVGLAFLDGAVAPLTPVDYQVAGKWGTAAWPWHTTRFHGLEPAALACGTFDGVKTRWSSGRALSLPGGAALQLDGVGALPLRIQFAEPAREVEIELKAPTAREAATRWRVTGRSANHPPLTTTSAPALSVTATGATLAILSPEGRALDEIEIRQTDDSWATWILLRLRHRSSVGAIGDQWSRIVRVSPAAGAVEIEPHVDVAWPPPAVETPSVVQTRVSAIPTALGEDGWVKPGSSQVEVVLAPPPALSADRPELARPVRVHTGYRRESGGEDLPTLPLPVPGQILGPPIAFWRLDGTTIPAGSPLALIERGRVQYLEERLFSSNVLDMRRRTLSLTGLADSLDGGAGPGYLEAASLAQLEGGSELHIQVWVMPVDDAEPLPTLVGNDERHSFRFGLAKAGGRYRLRLGLNGQSFESGGAIPSWAWSHVAVHYDGEGVRFFINGRLDLTHTAALGPLRSNPRRTLCIGCDPIPPDNPFAYPFAGCLADLQIRRGAEFSFLPRHLLAHWAFDGDFLERKTGTRSGTTDTGRFTTDHPEIPARRSARLDGSWCVVAPDSHLADPGRRLCLKLRVKPDPGQTGMATLAGTRGWQLGLYPEGTGYRAVLTVGTVSVAGSGVIAPARWSELVAGADGEHAVFYVNGRPAGQSPLIYGRIPRDASGILLIGAGAPLQGDSLATPFRGSIADLEIGDTLPGAPQPLLLVDREKSRALEDPYATVPPSPPEVPPADFLCRDLGPGLYRFTALGVDLFGRLGLAKESGALALEDVSQPPAPGGARARFLPLLGEVAAATPPGDDAPTWRLVVRLSRPGSLDAAGAARLLRHDAELARTVPAPEAGHPRRQRIERAETYEIATAELGGGGSELILHLVGPALPRLRPAAGQTVTIGYDRWVRIEWVWTGTQRLLAPDVSRFVLSERRRQARVTGTGIVPEGWTQRVPLGDPRGVPVAHDLVVQDEMGSTLIATRVTHAVWADLREKGVATLPEPIDEEHPPADRSRGSRAKLWRFDLPVRGRFPASTARLDPAAATPDDFVAGVLVAYNHAVDVLAWQQFVVLWHEINPAAGWILYVVENSRGRTVAAGVAPVLTQARYYPGQRYRVDAALAMPPSFVDLAGLPLPTVAMEIAVAAIDGAGRSSLVEPAAGDPLGGAAEVVAVDRRRPLPPPRPEVTIERADYYGNSRATVTWTPVEGESYHLHRATDSAVCARDTEQRRRGTGLYEGLEPEMRFADDPDFDAWLAARWPDWVAGWRTRLFVPRPSDEADRHAMSAWEAANAVWREWAGRFYPALPADSSEPSLASVAGRAGSEAAFALVNPSPIAGGHFVDTVNGAVRNRYLYRLRSQSPSLLKSTAYGPVSAPQAAPAMRPPAIPALTRIEGGERRLTVRWALNGEPELAEYRLYRARTRDALDDLRWWRPGAGEWVKPVPDPRLRVVGNGVVLPEGLDAAAVVGVFRAHEYGGRAFDYFSRDPAAPSEAVMSDGRIVALRRLRALPEGAAVVLIYRTERGVERTLGSLVDGGAYIDEDLLAAEDHFYRLVAVDSSGNLSVGSTILQGRAFDTTPPRPPPLDATFDAASREVRLSWSAAPGVAHLVQRYRRGGTSWQQLSDWLPPGVGVYDDATAERGARYTYRLRARSSAGVLNTTYEPRHVELP